MDYIRGFLAGAIILLMIFILMEKSEHNLERVYDERQELIRGKGYRYGFIMLLCSNIMIYFIELFSKELEIALPIDTHLLYLIATCICLYFFVAYCIFKDAFFSLRDQPKRYLILCLVIVSSNGFTVLLGDTFSFFYYFSLTFCILFTAIFLTIILHLYVFRGEE